MDERPIDDARAAGDARRMPRIELSWDDIKTIAQDHLAPAAALLLDAVENGETEHALLIAADIRDGAQAVLDGCV
jgi:hypothetical protein